MRSGREHCGSRVAVEQGRRGRRGGRGGRGGGGEEEEEQEEEEKEEEEEATDIKSNNPHLAGGEKSVLGGKGWTNRKILVCQNRKMRFSARSEARSLFFQL